MTGFTSISAARTSWNVFKMSSTPEGPRISLRGPLGGGWETMDGGACGMGGEFERPLDAW